MREPDAPILEVFLQPGDFYFGDDGTRIRTVLGSCVSITMWHGARRIGGMCHYMLPGRDRPHHGPPDGRYADEALLLFLREVRSSKTHPADYQVKLFGGGSMFAVNGHGPAADVGRRNVEIGRQLLARHGFRVVSEHIAGNGHRNLIFDVWSGDVWLRHQPVPELDEAPPVRRRRGRAS